MKALSELLRSDTALIILSGSGARRIWANARRQYGSIIGAGTSSESVLL